MTVFRRLLMTIVVSLATVVFMAGASFANCIEHAICYGDLDTEECHRLLGR